MKEQAASAVYREKVCLHLQGNYKQLRLNFITFNELSLVVYGMEFLRGRGGPLSRKIMEIPGGGGSYWKNPLWGVWIFSGSTQ